MAPSGSAAPVSGWGQGRTAQAPGQLEEQPAGDLAGNPAAGHTAVAQMQDHEGASLVRTTWRWAAATVILFPLFALWSLPSAAMTSRAAAAGDLIAARQEASLARLLGLISVVVFLVFVVLWLVMVIIAAAVGADVTTGSGTGVTSTPAVFSPEGRVSTA